MPRPTRSRSSRPPGARVVGVLGLPAVAATHKGWHTARAYFATSTRSAQQDVGKCAVRGANTHPVTSSTLGARVVGVLAGLPSSRGGHPGGGTQRTVHLEPVVVRAEAM